MRRLLVVEDDVPLAQMLDEYLSPEGFAVTLLHDGASAQHARVDDYDIVVLDIMLPRRSGIDLLRDIRKTSNVPVILLTARDSETDRVVGLELGADDYVAKPFKPRELVARLRAVLRRTDRGALPSSRLRAGAVCLDARARLVTAGGAEIDVTSAEFAMLECLLKNAGAAVSREALGRAALGRTGSVGLDRNVDTLISKLRRKLGAHDGIRTVRNVGYMFAAG